MLSAVEPVRIGPAWEKDDNGKYKLPELTLGWQILEWSADYLQNPDGSPWEFTPEQARFILWWYAVEESGRFMFRDGVLQRLKGWGKDPVGSVIAVVEMIGPCRFSHFEDGCPVAVDNPTAWVQIAATSRDQTKNTSTLFPSLFTKKAIATYGVELNKEIIYAHGATRRIECVTSSPRTLEGARASFVLRNETHHWLANNEGHAMDRVIARNATKSVGGEARALSITNAYEPSEDSVAQRAREAYESILAGTTRASGVLYDSLEAPAEAPLTEDGIRTFLGLGPDAELSDEQVREVIGAVIAGVRGDSVWLDIVRIVEGILDPQQAVSESRRFWYNQITAAEDAWVAPIDWDQCQTRDLEPGDSIALFFDGSKSDDATALIGVRLSDGLVSTLGMWQKPPGDRGKGWLAPRDRVDDRVSEVFDLYKPLSFFADPSHTRDDETQERYWDALIDTWHRRYKDRLELWAQPGATGHAVMWDMTSPRRSEQFTGAAERCVLDIEEQRLIHDGDRRLRSHVLNARRFPNKWGVSLWKGHRESSRKVDLAVAMVGARMVWRLLLNSDRKKTRSGKVW